MIRRTMQLSAVSLSFALLGACVPAAPVEIMSAREELRAASGSEAAAEAPAEITAARMALQEAEQCVARQCDPEVSRDLAYVASRHIERARTEAQIAQQIALQQEARRNAQDATARARLSSAARGGVGVAQSGASEPSVMVR